MTPPAQRGGSYGARNQPRTALSYFPFPTAPTPLPRGEVTRETSLGYDVTEGGPSGEEGAGTRRPLRACALGATREEAEAAVLRTAAAAAAAAEAGAGGVGGGGKREPRS